MLYKRTIILFIISQRNKQIEMLTRNRQSQTAVNSKSLKQMETVHGLVKQFVISTIGMVKMNIHEEDNVIEELLALLNNKMNQIYNKKVQKVEKYPVKPTTPRVAMQKIQAAVEQLNRESDNLSERLFDLSQNLIQKRLIEIEVEKNQLENNYENKLLKMKNQYETSIALLQLQNKQFKQRCQILQECLDEREDFVRKSTGKQDENRKSQLVKYLHIIEQIYEQLQVLKNFSVKQSINDTQGSYQTNNQYMVKSYPDNYSEQYYNVRKDQRSTQASSNYRKLQNPPQNYNYNQYYNIQDRNYPQKQDSQIEQQGPIIAIDRRSNSKNKYIESRYTPAPVPNSNRQNYYLNSGNQNRERSRSSQREKQKSNSKNRPIILHFANQPTYDQKVSNYESKSPAAKDSQLYMRRSNKGVGEQQLKRVEQKNNRMQGVEQKLFGLKRKLERELKTMKV